MPTRHSGSTWAETSRRPGAPPRRCRRRQPRRSHDRRIEATGRASTTRGVSPMNLFHEDRSRSDPRRLGRLARFIARHRWQVIGVWVVLTLFGAVAAGQLSSRWYQSLAVPGKPAYEASQRTLKALGVGVRAPNVVVFRSSGDATRSRAIDRAMQRAAATMPGARTSSYFSTGSLVYASRDRHTTVEEVYL